MLRFAKRHRTLSSIRKISPCIKVWLYALKLLLFSNLQDPFFKSSRSFLLFHYKRISFSRLDLKMIYKSQNNRFLKFIMFFLTLSWRRPLSYRNQSNQWTGSYMITASVMKGLNEHVAPKLLLFLKKELTCSYVLIPYYLTIVKYPW